MKSRYRSIVVVLAISAAVIAMPIFGLRGLVWLGSGCDAHDQTDSMSPDGKWHARWGMEGCHGLLMFTSFNSKVVIAGTDAVKPLEEVVVYESDSPDPVQFSWPNSNTLNIHLPDITYVARSMKSMRDLTISYSVDANVLKNLQEAERRTRSGLGQAAYPGMTEADRKTLEQVDRDYLRYLESFDRWIRDNATVSQP